MAEVLGSHNLNSIIRLRTARRITAIAVVIAAQLGSTGFAIGVAAAGPGLTTAVTVRIDGATGRWTPTDSAAVPAETVATDPATAPPAPTSDQSIVPTTPAASQTITPTGTTTTPPVDELSSPNEPEPTSRS
ncbi:hypothetical protein [Micromonospora sp. CPCC 206061]|uniref:hypothetical protein n=1 Tax=Micromonospora sp. CPCC 206061 TaxID=3122410 RepID=UPI002FF1602A